MVAKQSNLSITEYMTMLKNLWQEMDHYQSLPMKDQNDVFTLQQFIEKDWIYDFLARLWVEYDQIQVQIFGN